MEQQSHVLNNDVVDVCEQFGCGVVPEFPGAESVEPSDSAQQSALLR